MASTSWDTVRTTTTSGNTFDWQTRSDVSSISRTNNTITLNSYRSQFRVVRTAGSWTALSWPSDISSIGQVPSGTGRTNAVVRSGGSDSVNTSVYSTPSTTFNVSVGSGASTVSTNDALASSGVNYWGANRNFSIPTVSAPAGSSISSSLVTPTSARLTASVSGWGSNCTAGTGQRVEYKISSSGTWTNLAYSTATSHNRDISGLTPNALYNTRTYAVNGAGLSASSSQVNFATLSSANETTRDIFATSADFMLATVQGYRTTTTKIQYRKTGDVTWIDSAGVAGGVPKVFVSGLLPNQEYQYRIAVTTTDGTWTSVINTFTTLPAGKLIYPDGTVVNAIPRMINPDGTTTMVNINLIDPS
jgi:hypothetical protein